MFDNTLELLYLAGRSLPHAVMMMIPSPGRTTRPWTTTNVRSTSTTRADGALDGPPRSRSPTAGRSARCSTAMACALALLRHQRRPRDSGLRGRRARRAAESVVQQKAACSPAACSWWTPSRAASSTTRRSSARSPRSARTRVARRVPRPPRRPAGGAEVPAPDPDTLLQRQIAFGYTFEDERKILTPMARDGVEAVVRWATTRHSRCCRTSRVCCMTISSSCSQGHQPADRLHPRGADHLRRDTPRLRGQPAEPAALRLPALELKWRSSPTRSSPSPPHGPAGLRVGVLSTLFA